MRIQGALFWMLLVCALSGCASGSRMARAMPFWRGDELPDADRINAWPVYYQEGDLVVVAWPFFDRDDAGFALRPLVAREESQWSVLFSLAGWNTESGNWWLIPAYSLEENRGLLPLWNLGDEWNHVGLVWWVKDAEEDVIGWGVAPLFGTGEIKHVGPVWWQRGEGPGSWGFFPLAFFDQRGGYVLTAWWNKDEEGNLGTLGVLPVFLYENDDGYERLITPLGGRSWGGDGDKRFVNVLGPVFHHSTDGEKRYTAVAWPLFAHERDGQETGVRLFPLFHYRGGEDHDSFSVLAGLIGRARHEDRSSRRFLPLFSHNEGMPHSFWEYLTVYGYHAAWPMDPTDREARTDVSLHVGTPLLFNYRRSGDRTEWGSLLNILDYEAEGDTSGFSFLYFLYRQRRQGEQVRRDLFPFLTWDSGPDRSGFSFLWRLFRYERSEGTTRGHFLFVPWGG